MGTRVAPQPSGAHDDIIGGSVNLGATLDRRLGLGADGFRSTVEEPLSVEQSAGACVDELSCYPSAKAPDSAVRTRRAAASFERTATTGGITATANVRLGSLMDHDL